MKPKEKISKVKLKLNKDDTQKLIVDYHIKLEALQKEYIKILEYEKKKFCMVTKIINEKNNLWCPPLNTNLHPLDTNSWFSIKESDIHNTQISNKTFNLDEVENVEYKAKRITLILTPKQKNIINSWLNAYSDMYNIALGYAKEYVIENKKPPNFIQLRSFLIKDKKELVKRSNIKVHDIDYAIKLVCKNYKSALTNYKRGFIKHFRIRYWKQNRKIKIMDMEKQNFKGNSIRKNILGEVKGYYNNKLFSFDTINCDCRLQKNNEKYYLYVPTVVTNNNINNKQKSKQISIDLGVRTFCTGITENKIVEIGENVSLKLKKYLERKDKILENANISKEIKNKNEEMINKKISNLRNELHWKCINFLVKRNENILIGNMSSKSIIKKGGNLTKMTKRIVSSLNYFKFMERLKYKCSINKTGLAIIDEWMTSKMCSLCGNIKENLGGNKIYECSNCLAIIDRDINGARNIYIKSIKN
jgi:putative transposase